MTLSTTSPPSDAEEQRAIAELFGAPPVTVASILRDMAQTFEERNAVYKDNYKMVGPMMAILFPNGLPPGLFTQDQFHLFELILVKVARFASSGLTHIDSAHDGAVYFAMIEKILQEQQHENRTPAKGNNSNFPASMGEDLRT